jgi:seryl-tRNA synthetase
MLDIQLLRKDLDGVAKRLADRGYTLDVAAFTALEAERRDTQTRTEEMQARRNSLSKQIGAMKGRGEDTSAVMAEVGGEARRHSKTSVRSSARRAESSA